VSCCTYAKRHLRAARNLARGVFFDLAFFFYFLPSLAPLPVKALTLGLSSFGFSSANISLQTKISFRTTLMNIKPFSRPTEITTPVFELNEFEGLLCLDLLA
jgi:hypothetical protein